MKMKAERRLALRRHYRMAGAMLVVTVGAACAPSRPPEEPAASPAAIEATVQEFKETWEREDLEAAVSAFTADAVVYDPVPPGKFEGTEAIRAWTSGSFETLDEIAISLSELRVQTASRVAWVTGRYLFEAQQQGKPARFEGYMSIVLVPSVEGSYKLSVFHASHAPPMDQADTAEES